MLSKGDGRQQFSPWDLASSNCNRGLASLLLEVEGDISPTAGYNFLCRPGVPSWDFRAWGPSRCHIRPLDMR